MWKGRVIRPFSACNEKFSVGQIIEADEVTIKSLSHDLYVDEISPIQRRRGRPRKNTKAV